MTRHILPNIASSVIVLFTIAVAVNILAESALSYLGLGVDPRIPTWGGMLADGQLYITSSWWVATFPGIAIMLTVMGFNLIGDWLRDRIDPKYRV
jgi:peptide/nickel transport system permease protein